jgi:formate-dependent nitrite reductase membrane component NrfD
LSALRNTLAITLGLTLAITLGETVLTPISEDVRQAHHAMTKGPLSGRFWGVSVATGIVLPILLLLFSGAPVANVVAAVAALLGLFVFEDVWVKAGQAAPLS